MSEWVTSSRGIYSGIAVADRPELTKTLEPIDGATGLC
jgi:hypothetical protein